MLTTDKCQRGKSIESRCWEQLGRQQGSAWPHHGQIELSEGRLHVHRVKNGIPSVHPIRGDEMRALRKLRRDYPRDAYVFVSERGGPISPIGFHRLIQRVGEAAKICTSAGQRPTEPR
jgi:integrase